MSELTGSMHAKILSLNLKPFWSCWQLTPKKIKRHVTLTTPPFREFFSGVMLGYMGSCTPNFKFATLAILELLTFNAQKFKGHVTLTTPPFRGVFFRGRVGTLPGIMHAKFEVCNFSHFGAIGI